MSTTANSTKYANFFKRFIAVLIDGIILIIFGFIAFGRQPNEIANPQAIMYNILAFISNWLYFAIMESSSLQATLGKQLLGIAVTNTHGNQISFGQATARYFGKVIWVVILIIGLLIGGIGESTGGHDSPYWAVAGLLFIISFLTLIIGYIMALFTPEKQALHDIIARCLVVNDRGTSATIPWKPLIIVAILAMFVGRGILPQIPGSNNSLTVNSTPTSEPIPTELSSPAETPSPSPIETREIRSQILNHLEGLTLDNIQITDIATPRTYNICGSPLQLLMPNKNDQGEIDWKLDWTQGGIAYVSRLKMHGYSGKMRSLFPDDKGGLTTVDETMQLYTSAKGLVLLGFNPVDVETQKLSKSYKADNLIIRKELDSSITIINCDNGGNNSSVIVEPFGKTP